MGATKSVPWESVPNDNGFADLILWILAPVQYDPQRYKRHPECVSKRRICASSNIQGREIFVSHGSWRQGVKAV